MSEILTFVLIIPIIAYLLFVELVGRHTERVYQTDVDGEDSNLLLKNSEDAKPATTAVAWKGWRKVVVAGIHDESIDCRSFKLQSLDNEPLPQYMGGQSIQVRIPSNDGSNGVSRFYSLSSGPGEHGYRITVRRVPQGQFSTQLHDTINVGDVLEIKAPRGRFHIPVDAPDRPLHLIAAGIGITPMLSMLLHSLEETPSREVHLYYQLRDEKNAPFLKALRFLNQSLGQTSFFRLRVWFSGGAENQIPNPDDFIGRITADQVITGPPGSNTDCDYRICGPVKFMESMAQQLIALGAQPETVQYESFGGKLNRPAASLVKADAGAPSIEHRVTFCNSKTEAVYNNASDTLLDVAEASSVPVMSSCRSGICGSCVHRKKRGQVEYTEQPECEFSEGEVVLCMARPTSDIELEV